MSQDNFWEQWTSAEAKKEQEARPAGSEPAGSDADDILAAWLQALPPTDETEAAPKPASGSGAESASVWPPSAPVDPFSAISKNAPPSAAASEWDLALDVDPTPAPPAAPPAGASGLGDFALGSGKEAAAPAANPFAPPPPPVSPFGPPVPPVAPPQEALQAPPLRVEVSTRQRTVELECKGEALIGRPDATRGIHPEIDLRLDDAVSRRHAKIFIRDNRYVLTDLNSTNGTRVNGEWVQPEMEVQLKPGDVIEVGEHTKIRVLEAPNPNA